MCVDAGASEHDNEDSSGEDESEHGDSFENVDDIDTLADDLAEDEQTQHEEEDATKYLEEVDGTWPASDEAFWGQVADSVGAANADIVGTTEQSGDTDL